MAEKNKQKKILGLFTVRSVVQGRSFLDIGFFVRNWMYVLAAVVMMIMYISNKYYCQSNLREVIKLTEELDNARTDCVNASAKYNSMIRESQLTERVKGMNIDVEMPQQPPYQLTSDESSTPQTETVTQ